MSKPSKSAKSAVSVSLCTVLALLLLAHLLPGCAKRPGLVTPLPNEKSAAMAIAPSYNGASTPAAAQGFFPGEYAIEKSRSSSSEVLKSLTQTDELWVLARGATQSPQSPDDAPGTGALLAEIDQQEIPMPLKHTDVHASISGFIGTVEVTQQFLNPYFSKIEAVYVFPLPHNAAVNEFIMTIGERRIRGIIRERAEAEKIYREAKSQGYVASLLTEERPNIFTQRVANIEPGKQIDVNIKYFHTLEFVDGWYEFVFPMLVGPRFNPPQTTNGIGAVARGQTGKSRQETEVHYLHPHERTTHDISLAVNLDAGVRIEEFECKTHRITSDQPSPERLNLSIAPTDKLPNKDFVLRYRVAGEHIKSGLFTYRDQRGGFFALVFYPPAELQELKRQPLELVFVLDCSGSMDGRPIEQAKAAVGQGLRLLQPGDSFQIITFSLSSSTFGDRPVEATPANIARALQYVRSLHGEGGTIMLEGIKAALDFPHDPHRLRFVCFLTDGYIGNESEILGEIHHRLGPSRIFSFGIGSSVNRYLIDQMAVAGRGAVAYLGPNDSAAQIMENFFTRISHPAIADLNLDWGTMHVTEVFPKRLPDVFCGRPVVVAGRFAEQEDSLIRVNGNAAGKPVQITVPATLSLAGSNHPALPSVWARMKIAELAQQSTYSADPELADAIKQVALDYSLMSPFTAFVAVDASSRTQGAEGVTVPVAVPVPDGVKYSTTVDEN